MFNSIYIKRLYFNRQPTTDNRQPTTDNRQPLIILLQLIPKLIRPPQMWNHDSSANKGCDA